MSPNMACKGWGMGGPETIEEDTYRAIGKGDEGGERIAVCFTWLKNAQLSALILLNGNASRNRYNLFPNSPDS